MELLRPRYSRQALKANGKLAYTAGLINGHTDPMRQLGRGVPQPGGGTPLSFHRSNFCYAESAGSALSQDLVAITLTTSPNLAVPCLLDSRK